MEDPAKHKPATILVIDDDPAMRTILSLSLKLFGYVMLVAGGGEEALVIVQEVERTARHTIDIEAIKGRIREAVADNHELSARHIALIRPGALPKTTSGKIQRKLARKLWLDGSFEEIV